MSPCLRGAGKSLSKSPFPSCSLECFVNIPDLIDVEHDLVKFVSPMLISAPKERLDAMPLFRAKRLRETPKQKNDI